jgi:hypothetical protein
MPRTDLSTAHTELSEAIEAAAARARRPGSGGKATVDPTVTGGVTEAEDQ